MWELRARDAFRDLVARYNANGDTGRFDELMDVFAPDAVMEVRIEGRAPYLSRAARDPLDLHRRNASWAAAAETSSAPAYVRHFLSSHQIDIVDRTHARGRAYFPLLMAHGLDHWGRYLDEYEEMDGRWLFTFRRCAEDERRTTDPPGLDLPRQRL